MDRIEAMSAFVAVADLRGFAQAARQLKMSPSAITRLVAALEDHLSIRLLHRTTRSVALTDAGARYLPSAREIIESVRQAEATARAHRSTPSGRFVVSAPLVFGRREVAPFFSEYVARFPDVKGELVLSDRIANLVEEGIDAAVRIGALDDSSVRIRTVGATRRVLVASRTYLAAHKRPRTPKDLGDHALIHVTPLAPLPEWRFFRAKRRERVAIRPAFVTNSADAAIVHARSGGGIAMVLSYQVSDLVRAGELVILLAKYEPRVLPINIAYAATREPSANVRTFIDMAVSSRSWKFVDL